MISLVSYSSDSNTLIVGIEQEEYEATVFSSKTRRTEENNNDTASQFKRQGSISQKGSDQQGSPLLKDISPLHEPSLSNPVLSKMQSPTEGDGNSVEPSQSNPLLSKAQSIAEDDRKAMDDSNVATVSINVYS